MADNIDPEIVRQFTEALSNATRELNPITQANRVAAQQTKELAEETKRLRKQLGDSVVGLVSLTATANKSSAKYGQGIETMAGAAGKLVTLIPGIGQLGKVIGGVIGIFGQLASASLKQNDALMKTYQDLGKFGANSSSSYREMLDNLQRAGFNSENAEQFVGALKKVGPELALFGSATGLGAKRLTEVFTRSLGDTEQKLARFGYTTEEMFDYTSSYIAQQSVIGTARLKTDKQLNLESNEYMKTLAELSILTGAQRDELDKNRRANENDLRYQWTLRKLEMSDREEDRERAKSIRFQVDAYNALGAKNFSEGLKSIVANNGQVVDDIAADLQFAVGPQGIGMMVDATQQASFGAGKMADLLNKLSPLGKQSLTSMENTFAAGNDNLRGVMDGMGTFRVMIAGESADSKKVFEQLRSIEQEQDNDRISQNTRRIQNERKLNNTMENATFSIGNKVVSAMTGLSNITTVVSSAFAKLAKAMTFGAVDYTKEFQTAGEVMTDAVPDLEKYKKVTKEIANLEEQKKKAVEGSKEELNISKRLNELKGQQKSTAQSLMKADTRAKELGGQGLGSPEFTERLQSILTPQRQAVDVANSDIDKLFTFTGAGGRSAFEKMDSNFTKKLISAATEYSQLTNGKKLQINSSFRSMEEQQRLYDDYVSGRSTIPAAPPGSSKHQMGQAVDVQNYMDPMAIKALNNAGLFQKIANDPVHFEGAYNGAIFRGPKSGYWAKLHGTEGVFNEKQMSALSNSLTRHPFESSSSVSSSSDLKEYISAVIDKLDSLVELQQTNNRTNEEHLQFARTN
jgi:LAS superfamily LD-carboxypeptidase LdcB